MLPNNNNCTDKEKGNFLDFVSFDITRNIFSYFYKKHKAVRVLCLDAVLGTLKLIAIIKNQYSMDAVHVLGTIISFVKIHYRWPSWRMTCSRRYRTMRSGCSALMKPAGKPLENSGTCYRASRG